MNALQVIYDIAELCFRKGVREAILCPGSRCAPLTIAFARHPQINTRTISDERSAGFIALGIAQQKKEPVVLICTSGTAAYNFAPAVAEAFFLEVPLLVFTADRPAEWIGQLDGQTIYQDALYGRHVKKSFNLPQQYDHPDDRWHVNRIINDSINTATQYPAGPLHINVPLREPFYPGDELISYSTDVRVLTSPSAKHTLAEETRTVLLEQWQKSNRVLIVSGQHLPTDKEREAILAFSKKTELPVIGDITANLNAHDHLLTTTDLLLASVDQKTFEQLQPDLVITFGKSVLAKSLKQFIRKAKPRVHWHLQEAGPLADPFQTITSVIPVSPETFFTELELPKKDPSYLESWINHGKAVQQIVEEHLNTSPFHELKAVARLLNTLPSPCNLHLSNSMSVRYANFIGLSDKANGVTVYSNRGTSGIDGCTSTAYGHSLASGCLNILITGDLAFFHDRNAFWNNYPADNLRVVLLNNHGGLIFSLIDGPSGLPEADEYFVTHQRLTAGSLCAEYGLDHYPVHSEDEFINALNKFLKPGGPAKVLEVETPGELNKTLFESLKNKIKKYYEAR